MHTRDMTKGNPARMLLAFALPMIAGNLCQQLYTIVDAFFVGRYAGFQALAAVGAADWLSWMVFGVAWGYTQGFSILISQRFGADDVPGVKRTVANAVLLTGVICVGLSAVSLVGVKPMLRLLETPEDILEEAALYLYILFAAMPILGAYNVQAGILRAVGDAKTPLFAMVIASFANIVLDALLIIYFDLGVLGAALGTVIAQAVSAVYCFVELRRIPQVQVSRGEWRFHGATVRELVKLGTPTALQNVVIGVGGTAVQRVINTYGTIFVAGFTATNKLYGLMEMAAVSLGGALSAYTGQNWGAQKYNRIRQGVRSGTWMAVSVSVAIAGLLFLVGRSVLAWFINAEDALVIEECLNVGQAYLNAMLFGLVLLYLLHIYRCVLQGMGDTVTPMISGVVELGMRIGAVLILPLYIQENGIYLAEPLAWLGAAVLLGVVVLVKIKRLPQADAV